MTIKTCKVLIQMLIRRLTFMEIILRHHLRRTSFVIRKTLSIAHLLIIQILLVIIIIYVVLSSVIIRRRLGHSFELQLVQPGCIVGWNKSTSGWRWWHLPILLHMFQLLLMLPSIQTARTQWLHLGRPSLQWRRHLNLHYVRGQPRIFPISHSLLRFHRTFLGRLLLFRFEVAGLIDQLHHFKRRLFG